MMQVQTFARFLLFRLPDLLEQALLSLRAKAFQKAKLSCFRGRF
jgi:hypothetical protein